MRKLAVVLGIMLMLFSMGSIGSFADGWGDSWDDDGYYDPWDEEVYPEEPTQPTTKTYTNAEGTLKADSFLGKFWNKFWADGKYDQYKQAAQTSTQDEPAFTLEAAYDVVNGALVFSSVQADYGKQTVPSEPTATKKALHQKAWDQSKKITPADQLKYVTKFKVGSDGKNGTLAYVSPINSKDLSKWEFVLDTADTFNADGSFQTDLNGTLVHEFGHLTTLNTSQMEAQRDSSVSTAIINYDAARIYNDYANNFVSEYAATNPEEDIAETYRFFIFGDKPTGTLEKDQKVLFFYDFPAAVQFRDFIRNALGSNIPAPKNL